MNPISKPLLLPLTCPTISELGNEKTRLVKTPNLVEVSCSAADPSVLVSWGLSCRRLASEQDDAESPGNGLLAKGAIMGCKDGTVYVFHATRNRLASPMSIDAQTFESTVSRPTSPFRLSRHSRPASGSASPSSTVFHQTPFHISPRSRVVSGLSTEQAEAPKNFVDFDDEAEKLKDMLKGKSTRDKVVPEVPPSHSDKAPILSLLSTPSVSDTGVPGSKRKNGPRSLLSATNSPAFTPTSISVPTSPRLLPVISAEGASHGRLSLQCHIIPPRSGPGNSITGMQLIDCNRFLVTVQAQG